MGARLVCPTHEWIRLGEGIHYALLVARRSRLGGERIGEPRRGSAPTLASVAEAGSPGEAGQGRYHTLALPPTSYRPPPLLRAPPSRLPHGRHRPQRGVWHGRPPQLVFARSAAARLRSTAVVRRAPTPHAAVPLTFALFLDASASRRSPSRSSVPFAGSSASRCFSFEGLLVKRHGSVAPGHVALHLLRRRAPSRP